uniref:Uncharacterized protein n=1 Tax=Caenorhabditis japonica TaxID=281687 RepID=A0A8R1EQM9_CAEJA
MDAAARVPYRLRTTKGYHADSFVDFEDGLRPGRTSSTFPTRFAIHPPATRFIRHKDPEVHCQTRTRRSHLRGRTSTNVWSSPGSFSSQVQIIFERHPYWFIAKYRTVERVLSEPQPFMELGRDYDITKKNPVMANGLMRPVLIRTQQLIPLKLARGIRLGHHRQRFMRLTDALSQGWMVHPVAKEVLPWKDSWHEMLRAGWKLAPSTLTTATTPLQSLA